MVPAAVKIAICQNRSLAMFAIEIRRPLTRIILESQSRYSFVVAEAKRVHQRKASNPCVIPALFAASVTKKPHNALNGPVVRSRQPSCAPFRHYIGREPRAETFMTSKTFGKYDKRWRNLAL